MNDTMNVNVKGVQITLTPEQIATINRASKPITERIKSYFDACEELGIEVLEADNFNFLPEIDQQHAFASHRLTIIARALNEGWTPDWSNPNQYKYYGWFKYVGSGAGFSFHVCDYDRSATGVGSRLCFKTRELAEYAGKAFTADYNTYLTL